MKSVDPRYKSDKRSRVYVENTVFNSLKGYSKEDIGSILKGDLPKPKDLQGFWSDKDYQPYPYEVEGLSGEASPVYVHSHSQLTKGTQLTSLEIEKESKNRVYIDGIASFIAFKPSFLGFLEHYFENAVWVDVKSCGSLLRMFWCEHGSHYVARAIGCRHRRVCPKCAGRYTWNKVEFAYDLFKRMSKHSHRAYLNHIVLTLPPFLWDIVRGDEDRFFKVVYRLFQRLGNGLSGGVSAFHMWRSKDPLRGYYPHIHTVTSNLVLHKNSSERNGLWFFKRVRPYFSLDRFKRLYYEELCREFKESEELKSFDYEKINIWVHYLPLRQENRVKHLLKYVFRLPITDFYDYLSKDLDSKSIKFVMDSLYFKKKRVRWWGFLADGVKTKWLKRLGVKYTCFTNWLRNRELLCPIHGTPLIRLGLTCDRSTFLDGG